MGHAVWGHRCVPPGLGCMWLIPEAGGPWAPPPRRPRRQSLLLPEVTLRPAPRPLTRHSPLNAWDISALGRPSEPLMGLGVPFPFPKPCGVSLSLGVYKRLAGARVRPPVPPSVHLEFPNCHPCGKGWRGGWGRAGRVPSRAAGPPPPPRLPPVPGRASGFPVLLKPGCVLRETGVHPAGNRGASYRSVHPSFAGDVIFFSGAWNTGGPDGRPRGCNAEREARQALGRGRATVWTRRWP